MRNLFSSSLTGVAISGGCRLDSTVPPHRTDPSEQTCWLLMHASPRQCWIHTFTGSGSVAAHLRGRGKFLTDSNRMAPQSSPCGTSRPGRCQSHRSTAGFAGQTSYLAASDSIGAFWALARLRLNSPSPIARDPAESDAGTCTLHRPGAEAEGRGPQQPDYIGRCTQRT